MLTFYLPEELLRDVLSRLPVEDLLCCSCVLKSWRDLIRGRDFKKMILNRSAGDNFNFKFVVHNNPSFCWGRTTIIDDCSENAVTKLNYPFLECKKGEEKVKVRVEGSCNGVLCLRYGFRKIYLWNPLSRKYHELPCLSVRYIDVARGLHFDKNVVGFGYDQMNDDFKVLALLPTDFNGGYDCWIYSLNLKRWKGIGQTPSTLMWGKGAFVSGAIHWKTTYGLIVGLNLTDEKFYKIPQPDSDFSNSYCLGALNDCLSITDLHASCMYYELKMWVMKEYGFKNSWTMINMKLPQDQVSTNLGCWRTFAYGESKQQVIIHNGYGKPFLYDLEKQSMRKWIECKISHTRIYPYLETLECFDG